METHLHAELVEQAVAMAVKHRGSVGDACDNAMCESFVATLECELLDRCTFADPTEARRAVFGAMEDLELRSRPSGHLDVVPKARALRAPVSRAGST